MYKGRHGEFADSEKAAYRYAETDPTGRYGRFQEVLGKGAMKTVYRAIDEVLGMEVAWNQVKLNELLQSPDDLQRLYKEVHLLRTLNHESIIRFYTSWIDVDRRTFNFITEMFTSGSLREYRKKYKQVSIRAIKVWARQILSGIIYLHGHDPPVIHRDLKCDNIFVNGHLGQVKIGDLGLAAILRGSYTAHSVIGTPEFMAPELYEENYNELVDVYSFGMCVLEMLTSEYPYSECSNPAQIYKKVTSGQLPKAFYKIHDPEAQRFIGRCIETASKRSSAKELMLDPFLAIDEDEQLLLMKAGDQKPFLNDGIGIEKLQLSVNPPRTNMTITGKLNPEDDAIFLKVQLADKEGSVNNVFFPFDVASDTPRDVATEMVRELEIIDWEPLEIAEMIDGAISALLPQWKKWDRPDNSHTINYHEDDDGHRHPFYSCTSSSSSQVSLSGLVNSHRTNERNHDCDWIRDDLFDDTSSQSSLHSGMYSHLNYNSGDDHESYDTSGAVAGQNQQQQPVATKYNHSTRFSTEASCITVQSITRNCYEQLNVTEEDSQQRRLTRNKSLVDLRSQLLHRSLVEEVNRRYFKTVGAVENIGFQTPCDVSSSKTSSSRQATRGSGSVKTRSEGKRQGNRDRRV